MDSLDIDLWCGEDQCFGHSGTPSLAVNVVGRVSSPHGVHAMGYQLNGGKLVPLSLGPTAFRLLGEGDFNIELDRDSLVPGDNELRLRATDQAGNELVRLVNIDFAADQKCELPCRIKWSEVSNLQNVAQIVDGHWRLDADGLRVVEMGYDRLVAVGDVSWRDYVITAPITIHEFSDLPAAYGWPSFGAIVGFVARWKRHADWHDLMPPRGYLPLGAIGLYRWHRNGETILELFSGSDGSKLASCPACEFEPGMRLVFKLAVQSRPDGPSEYSFKVWPDGQDEPSDWNISAVNLPGELDSGAVLLLAHHTDATFGNVLIEPL